MPSEFKSQTDWKSSPFFYFAISFMGYLIPYVFYWRDIGTGDWDVSVTFAQIAVWWFQEGNVSVSWNPFLCGGYPLFANAQVPIFHPNLPLFWLFGPAVGLKISTLVWMTLGFWIAFQFARALDFARREASVFSAVWVLNGFFVAHLSQMHAFFTSFFLIPGFYLLVKRWIDTERVKYLALLTGLFVFCSVGSYAFLAYFFISVPCYFLLELFFRKLSLKASFRLAVPFFISLLFNMALLSFYILPVLSYMRKFPRTISPEFVNPLKLATFLFFPGRLVSVDYFTWEYQFFIGPILFYFFLLALRKIRTVPLAYRSLVACAFLHVILSIGSLRPLGIHIPMPLDLLRDFVPGFSNVRVVSRFLIGAIPGILVLAFWQWRQRGIGWKSTTLVLAPLLAFQINNSFTVAFARSQRAATKPAPITDTDFAWRSVDENKMFQSLSSHTGITDCYDPTPKPGTSWEHFEGPLAIVIPENIGWRRPNWGFMKFVSNHPSSTKSEIKLQMNFHPDWRIRSRITPAPAFSSSPSEAVRIVVPPGMTDFDLVFESSIVERSRFYSLYALVAYFFFLGIVRILERAPLPAH